MQGKGGRMKPGMPGSNMANRQGGMGMPGGPGSGMGMQGGPAGGMMGPGMMEQRMDMMHMMMEQMLQNQSAIEETRMIRRRHDHRKMK